MSYAEQLKQFTPRGLWPYLGAVRRWVRAVPPRTHWQKQRLLKDPALQAVAAELALIERASSRIDYNDGMYKGDGVHYYKVGLSAIRCIDGALKAAGKEKVGNLLDLPCGYGRVLRLLVHRFPEAKIAACELERGAVDFCVAQFGAAPFYSSIDLDSLTLGAHFDLIWCGSLITHLNDIPVLALLKFFRRHLSPGGLVVFTTHGDFVARRMPLRDFDYGLTTEQIAAITARYAETGFAYTDYFDRKNYGVSLTSPAWIRGQVGRAGGLREVYFRERGWDEHQDVFGFVSEG